MPNRQFEQFFRESNAFSICCSIILRETDAFDEKIVSLAKFANCCKFFRQIDGSLLTLNTERVALIFGIILSRIQK